MIKGKIKKGASTVREGFDTSDIFFKKLKDMGDEMANHNCEVVGMIVNAKNTKGYGTSYALVCRLDKDDETIGVNIPRWVGEELYNDFEKSGQTADEYFNESFLVGFDTIKTAKGNDTYNPIFE